MIGHTKSNCFVMKNGRGKVGWKWSILMVMVVCFCGLGLGATTRDVSAGAKIGKDENMGSGSTGGGGGGSPGSCDRGSASSGDCMGVSWIYFEATGDVESEVEFYPDDGAPNAPAVKIPKECSKEGRGFWAFGIGGLSSFNQSYGVYSFVNTTWGVSRNIGLGSDGSRYSTGVSSTGEPMKGFRNGIKPWAYKGGRSTPWIQGGYYTTYGKDTLNHVLYVNGKEIYKATKYGHIGDSKNRFIPKPELDQQVKNSTVFAEFKKAWKAEYKQEYPNGYTPAEGEASLSADDFPSWLDYFCYWDGMGDVTLTTSAQSVNGTVLRNEEKQTVPVDSPVSKDYGDKIGINSNTGKYKFKEWVNEDNQKINTSGNVSVSGSKLSVEKLAGNRSFTAIYYDPVKLTAKAISWVNGASINDIADVYSDEVARGDKASVTRTTKGGWLFFGWCRTKTSGCTDLGNFDKYKYTEEEMTDNKIVYAVYVPYYTIDGKSVMEGSITSNLTWSGSDTVLYDTKATMTADAVTTDSNGNQYGFIKWISNENNDLPTCPRSESYYACTSSDNKAELIVYNLRKDRHYKAVYGRRTLVGIPIEYGTGLNIENHIQRMASTVPYNTSTSITTLWNPSYNWKFQCWSTNYRCDPNNGLLSTSLTYPATLTTDVTVYAVYRRQYNVSIIMKNVDTKEKFDNIQLGVDKVDKFGNLGYSGSHRDAVYSGGVWSVQRWLHEGFSGILPYEVNIGTNSYRLIGWYSVLSEQSSYSQSCSDDVIAQKGYVGSQIVFETNNVTSCLAIWGAYVPVRKLTALALDTNGAYIGNNQFRSGSKWPDSEYYKRIYDQRKTVLNGESVSLTRYLSMNTYTDVGYIFKGWKKCPESWCAIDSTDPTYSISSLTADGTVYPIYEIRKMKLVGKSVDKTGTSLSNVSGLEERTQTVDYWSPAQLTRGTAEGYTFYGWAESEDNAKNGSYVTRTSGTTYVSSAGGDASFENKFTTRGVYHVASMTDDSPKEVYARYDRNKFEGRVRASGGTSVNESSNTSTGWVNTITTANTLTIQCPNDGCKATFDLYLRTIQGLGRTYYSVLRSKNGGNYGVVTPIKPESPSAPASYTDGGTAINKRYGNYTETLYPGETVCYMLSFKPYGDYTNSTIVDATACVSAKVSTFEGKSSVSGGITGTTDWRSANYKVISFKGCSPTTGCVISFDHQLRRGQDSGTDGWTDYTVDRISNLTSGDRGIGNTRVTSGSFYAYSSAVQTVSSSGPFTLYPGMVVCEMLTFRPSNRRIGGGSYDYSDVTTTVCASATGNAQPEDPPESKCTGTICENDPDGDNGSNALVDIEVKNTTVTKYNTYRRVVYGKPGDTLEYLGSYNPKLQYTYNLRPEQMKFGNTIISNGPTYPCMLGDPSVCQINGILLTTRNRSLFNEYVDPDWNNDFLVRSLNFVNSFSKAYDYKNGLISAQKETNSHTVLPAEVGCRDVNNPSTCSLNENAEINYPSNNDIKTTPVQVTFTNNGTNNLGTVMTNNVYRTAYARIPYNYKTEINLPVPTPEEPGRPEGPTVDPGDSYDSGNPDNPTGKVPKPEIVYAGESTPIDIEVKIKPKGNSVTNNPGGPDYATKTGKSTVKVIVYLADNPKSGTDNYPAGRTADLCGHFGAVHSDGSDNWKCSNYQVAEKELNEAGNLNGSVSEFQPSFNVPDLDAGKKICVAAAIFPSNSGDDANWNSVDGSNGWRISESRCFVVAKKPNLQVLGSNMFSAGRIFTSVAKKKNVYGFYPVMIGGNGSSVNTTVFGSWVEHGIVGLGQISNLASGASTGYFGRITSTTPMSGLGGSKEGAGVSYCRYRVPLSIANYTKTKLGGVPEQICPGEEIVGSLGNGSSLKQDSGDKDKLIARFTQNTENTGIEYAKTEGDYTIGLTEIPVGIIKVVHASGSITITDDLIYGTKDRNTGIIKEHDYAKLADIPKLVIYAEKNIYIGCNVKRIDAVLIAGKTNTSDGVINTCPTVFSKYTGDVSSQVNWKHNGTTLINSAANSNQLKINGTIIANRLIANRTYGAGKGRDSVEPAEIIDYDTTLYGWGMRESEASASGRLQTVYLHEVAPRY